MRFSGELTTPWLGIDDPLAFALHLGGAVFFAWQALRLVRRAGPARRRAAALAIFAGSAVGVLGTSAGYHALAATHPWKATMQRLDHAGIFVLIAGTLTSFHAIGFHGRGRSFMVSLVWAVAVTAMLAKVALWARLGDGVGLALYLGLSALGLSSLLFLPRRLPWRAFVPMGLGAVLYVAGAFADHWSVVWLVPHVLGPHELFHAAVLGALLLHWRFFHDWAEPGRAPLRLAAEPVPAV